MIGALIAKYKIHHAFDALNRRDFEVFLSDWREDCTFIYCRLSRFHPNKISRYCTHIG